jgi:hypothetical protein
MKSHLTDGELRAALDGELDSNERNHLESCTQCQSRQKLLEAQIGPTAERLRFSLPLPRIQVFPHPPPGKDSIMKHLLKRRPACLESYLLPRLSNMDFLQRS